MDYQFEFVGLDLREEFEGFVELFGIFRVVLELVHAARSWAFISGRDYALPEDIQAVLISVVGHRLRSRDDLAEIPARRLKSLFEEVPVS